MLSPFCHDSDRVQLVSGGARLLREQRLDLFHDLTWSWIPKAIRINNFSIININTELTQAALYNLYLSVIFFSQLGRHPGGHGLLDGSNRAVMDGDFLHNWTKTITLLVRGQV